MAGLVVGTASKGRMHARCIPPKPVFIVQNVTAQPLTFYGHINTAEQRAIIQQYGDWYTGR